MIGKWVSGDQFD